MPCLEDLIPGAQVKGVLAGGPVTVVSVKWHGSNAMELTYKDCEGRPDVTLLYRDREPALEILQPGRQWSFTADGALFRLVSEALRIKLAYLFDPLLAVNTSDIEPLPHQISAVYETMLPRQPLRFLLADDPGAGKTIMAGLLIKELLLRGDLKRCMVVSPGNLVEQWQDELDSRFSLPFEILTNDKLESARTGNWFQENDLVICRLDKLSRDQSLHAKLEQTDWDLIVCDEAHKMSASFFGGEVRYTKRHLLGRLLGKITRHFLLMTATPHSGKEEDFQLFMSLLDSDRFEGKFRDGVHVVDVTDLMRRHVKEQLVRFDGTPLFPERKAYTVKYQLSDAEAQLYQAVTGYVRDEFNRADRLANEGRKGNVGFALTILQRRLASSPAAISQSLVRRRERLESKLREEELLKRGGDAAARQAAAGAEGVSPDELEDLEDAPDAEVEALEQEILDKATASQTIEELRAEIRILQHLEVLARGVLRGGTDRKWEKVSGLLQEHREMFDAGGARRKLVIFTEHRDTLNYLASRIRTLLGDPRAIVTIHGALGREERKKAEESFKQDKAVQILVATDAAGEGINLQRAHLMINYDLPWNPNRLEQRFGRIHRIGQTEVCHLWNLVAYETREGDVFERLLSKLEIEREDLKGRVFDVLGKVFQGRELRELLIEAIRYGDSPEVQERLRRVVDERLDTKHLKELLDERALAHDALDSSRVQEVRDLMERARIRRLQPHFILSFFEAAFKHLGGAMQRREPGRYELTHVPAAIRNRDRVLGSRQVITPSYERITFEKERVRVPGKPPAQLITPGHPLLYAVMDLILERYRELLKQGTVLVDELDPGQEPRALMYLEHSIQDARTDAAGNRRLASRRLQFVEKGKEEAFRSAGYAPFLNYRPLDPEELALAAPLLAEEWLTRSLDEGAVSYAVESLVPEHLQEVRARREELVNKTLAAVKERLTQEISYWDYRAEDLRLQEQAGRVNARINSALAQRRADDLQGRLQKRLKELEQEGQLSALPPNVIGGALVVPAGLLGKLKGEAQPTQPEFVVDTAAVERLAMEAVMAAELRMGFEPRDVSADQVGWDIESRDQAGGHLRFIEVKGRAEDKRTLTITKNEIIQALHNPESFILAIVIVAGGGARSARYIRNPFGKEPDFGVTSVNYELSELLERSEEPR
jgi:superfamily II DNA or RNA helicase